MAFTLSSQAFRHEGEIPKKYTCEGQDVSPPLAWSDAPDGTQSFVLIVDDPDAPDPKAPKMTWVHWVLYDIPKTVTNLAEATTAASVPKGARNGINNWNKTGYGGPCPPIGKHRYFFKLYALSTELGDLGHATKDAIEAAMKGKVLAQATLMGTYIKDKNR